MTNETVEELRNRLERAQCRNCLFCNTLRGRIQSEDTFECRYNPPQIIDEMQQKFPNVHYYTGWCGHFIPAQELKDKE